MTEAKHDFQLSTDEADYLFRLAAHDESLARLLEPASEPDDRAVKVRLTHAETEYVRDRLTVKLAAVGFDEDYSPNEQGRVLEKLIDKFFLGGGEERKEKTAM
mgnify:CR=1 FL=1